MCEIRADVPATLVAIEEFLSRFRRWRSDSSADFAFPGELLLREALTNAALHGNCGRPGTRVRCVVRLKPGRLVIAVRDEGAGFRWREFWGYAAPVSATCGRGIEIFRHYASGVRFSSRGDGVTLVRRF